MTADFDRVLNQDCIAGLKAIPDGVVDLAFADPPFNIGYDYDVYHDRLESENYLAWSRDWTAEVVRVLKPNGTFWLAIGDEYAAELKVMLQREHRPDVPQLGRSGTTRSASTANRSSAARTRTCSTWSNRPTTSRSTPTRSASPRPGNSSTATPAPTPTGRLPDDTWILRPQDIPDSFTAAEDTWYFPRVCGTFKERAGFHGCQMPEQLLGRIIRACSHEPGEMVLDPFGGSGTTLVVAKKLGRRFLGFELSEQYAARVKPRLAAVNPGDPLDGAAEPLVSVPTTANGRKLDEVKPKKRLPTQSKIAYQPQWRRRVVLAMR